MDCVGFVQDLWTALVLLQVLRNLSMFKGLPRFGMLAGEGLGIWLAKKFPSLAAVSMV